MAQSNNGNVLRNIITPKLARDADKRVGAMTRWWLTLPADALSGMSKEAFGIRQLVWSVMTGAYLSVDRGETNVADKALAAAWVFDKKAARDFMYREAQEASKAGNNSARKLLDYARESRVPLREMVWSQSQGQLRKETDSEAAMRHLHVIAFHPKEDQPNRHREYRESMVRHGFMTLKEGEKITGAAIKEWKELQAKKKLEAEAAKPESKAEPKAEKPEVAKGLSVGDIGKRLKAL